MLMYSFFVFHERFRFNPGLSPVADIQTKIRFPSKHMGNSKIKILMGPCQLHSIQITSRLPPNRMENLHNKIFIASKTIRKLPKKILSSQKTNRIQPNKISFLTKTVRILQNKISFSSKNNGNTSKQDLLFI
jgi:hypothetical protein